MLSGAFGFFIAPGWPVDKLLQKRLASPSASKNGIIALLFRIVLPDGGPLGCPAIRGLGPNDRGLRQIRFTAPGDGEDLRRQTPLPYVSVDQQEQEGRAAACDREVREEG